MSRKRLTGRLLAAAGLLFFTSSILVSQEEDSLALPDTIVSVQDEDVDAVIEKLKEQYLENYTETSDGSQLSEQFEYYRAHPLDINIATFQELSDVPGLGEKLAHAIVAYRKKERYQTVRDLLKVPSMSREKFVEVKDFLTVRARTAQKRTALVMRQRTKRQMDLSDAFNKKYDGNPYQTYERVNLYYQPYWNDNPDPLIRAGMVLEKDPGERRYNDHQVGFIECNNFPYIRKAVIGNYQLEFGQALTMWSGTGLSKSSETIESVKKRARGIKSYNYASENSAYQGIAVDYDFDRISQLKPFDLIVFYSYSHYDVSKNPNGSVNSMLMDGYHRTPTEIARRGFLLETLGGFHTAYHFGQSAVGITYYASQYNRLFVINDTTRSRFNFSGHKNSILGADYDIYWKQHNWFGEVAKDRDHSLAFNSGWRMDWGLLELVLFYRNYSRAFQNFHGYAFGEQNGKTQNEEGIYTGIQYKPTRKTTLQAYYDIFQYPWRSYEVPKPVNGDDFLIQWEQKFYRSTYTLVRFKNERKDASYHTTDALGRDIVIVSPANTRRARYQIEQRITGQLRLKTRFEQCWYRLGPTREYGMLIHEDLRWQPHKNVTFFGRISFFDTPSFNTAVYEYENDVEGVFTNTALYGKGQRWYVMIKYRWIKQFQIALKYWEIYKDNVSEIGSGTDAVPGQVLRKITLSMDVNL